MQTRLRNVTVAQKPKFGSEANSCCTSACPAARSRNGPKPPNTENTTKMPTVRNAASLTMDSAATATISPSWCSVASMWRVPNSTAKAAIASAITRAVSMRRLNSCSGSAPSRVVTDSATALSCSAI